MSSSGAYGTFCLMASRGLCGGVKKEPSWRTHSCVQRRASLDASAPWAAGGRRQKCRRGTQKCVRHICQSVSHEVSRAEGPFQQTTKGDCLSRLCHNSLVPYRSSLGSMVSMVRDRVISPLELVD